MPAATACFPSFLIRGHHSMGEKETPVLEFGDSDRLGGAKEEPFHVRSQLNTGVLQ